jgi:hypothetical protein
MALLEGNNLLNAHAGVIPASTRRIAGRPLLLAT